LWRVSALTAVQYAVNIELHENEDGFRVLASCAADAMDKAGLLVLLEEFNQAVVDIVRVPSAPVLPDSFFTSSEASPAVHKGASSGHSYNGLSEPAKPAEVWDPEEVKLVATMLDFLSLPAGSINTNTHLAAVGIDSITSIQLSALARKVGLPLLAADVARSITVSDLVRIVKSKRTVEALPPKPARSASFFSGEIDVLRVLPPDVRKHITEVLPATSGMEWYVGAWQRSAGVRWHYAFAFRVVAPIDAKTMQRAWTIVVEASPALRSILLPSGDARVRLALAILDHWTPSFEETMVPAGCDEVEFVHEKAREIVRRTVSAHEPFSKMVFLNGAQENYVVLGLHHMQYGTLALSPAVIYAYPIARRMESSASRA
jgi:hypothetical protein